MSTKKSVEEMLKELTVREPVDWENGRQELGGGAYGKVYTVRYRGSVVAAKEIHEILTTKLTLNKFVHECYLCYTLSQRPHPNIVCVKGVGWPNPGATFPVMLMELMDENLTAYMERLPDDAGLMALKCSILLDVAQGLRYLHGQKPTPIVHRDLTPNNVLLAKDENQRTVAKIADLGVAKVIASDKTLRKLTEVPGTPDFMPPEAFEEDPVYNTSLDVFSYGGVTLFVACHQWPSPSGAKRLVDNRWVALSEVQRRQKYLDLMEKEVEVLKPLIEKCLSDTPDERPTMNDVAQQLNAIKLEVHNSGSESRRFTPTKGNISVASIQNERYSVDTQPSHDHENEDEHLVHADKHSVCMCVFDGHDGPLAVNFVKKYMTEWIFGKSKWADLMERSPKEIEAGLVRVIQSADDNFFKSIDPFIRERSKLMSQIPKKLNPSQAQQRYPDKVSRLFQLESDISGGCTAVVAVLTCSKLYVANVGDARAVLAYQNYGGPIQVKQLSEDHGVENEQEIERLMSIGLDREQLKKSGRLGTQENTRSIGDYSIKGGYKDVDVLSHATDEPGIAVPHIVSEDIDDYSFKYLILMSDGVYKTLEAIAGDGKSGNQMVVDKIEQHFTKSGLKNVTLDVLRDIREAQFDLFQQEACSDIHSPIAVANRKRDDMTLLIYKFDTAV